MTTQPASRRVTLGAYLAFAFSAMSVLLTVLLTLVIERTASERIGSEIAGNLAELANQTATRLDRGLFERYREMELLAARMGPRRDWAAMQEELTAMQGSYRFYSWIGVADTAGVVRAASRGMLVGAKVDQRPWYGNAKNGVQLGDVHEAVLLAKLVGTPGATEPPRFFDVAFPLKGPDGPAGVLGAHVSWEWAKDVRAVIFRPIGRSRVLEPLIVATDGVVLLGPATLQGQKLAVDSLRRAQAGETGSAAETWADGERYLVGYSKSKGHESSPGLGWSVLVRQPLDNALAPVRELQAGVLGSGVVIAILFSLLGWLIASGITRPLLELAHSARTMDSGEVALVKPSRAYREVETLGIALNTLVAELRRNESALRELNADLERRVERRTEELREAFERVRTNEQRIRTILEAAQDPFIGMDLDGRVTDWNSQAEVVFGWPREEILGRKISETLLARSEAENLNNALRDFQDTGDPRTVNRPMESVMVDREGRRIEVEVKVGLVSTGEQRFFGAFVHDISERKEVERLKDEFISTVSHELRTPLTSIYGSLDLLVSGIAGELPKDVRELLQISHESTQRLIRLINDMLDLDKIASGKLEYRMEPQDLRVLVQQAVRDTQAYADGYRVRLVLRDGADARVVADADRIVQVCVNLLSNAAKFSPAEGQVTVQLAVSDGTARVSVIDNGPGIPPEFRDRMFQRFAQADASDRRAKGGTGLGLSICRSIVQAHGGTMDFTSEPGVRTEFYFELPLAPAA